MDHILELKINKNVREITKGCLYYIKSEIENVLFFFVKR